MCGILPSSGIDPQERRMDLSWPRVCCLVIRSVWLARAGGRAQERPTLLRGEECEGWEFRGWFADEATRWSTILSSKRGVDRRILWLSASARPVRASTHGMALSRRRWISQGIDAQKTAQPVGDRALGVIEAAEEDTIAPFDLIGDHLPASSSSRKASRTIVSGISKSFTASGSSSCPRSRNDLHQSFGQAQRRSAGSRPIMAVFFDAEFHREGIGRLKADALYVACELYRDLPKSPGSHRRHNVL